MKKTLLLLLMLNQLLPTAFSLEMYNNAKHHPQRPEWATFCVSGCLAPTNNYEKDYWAQRQALFNQAVRQCDNAWDKWVCYNRVRTRQYDETAAYFQSLENSFPSQYMRVWCNRYEQNAVTGQITIPMSQCLKLKN